MVKKIVLTFILLFSFCFFSTSVYADETTEEYDPIYFTANSDIIYKSPTGILTLSEIKELVLSYLVYDETLSLSIQLLKDTYTGNGDDPGEYEIYYYCYYDIEGEENLTPTSLNVTLTIKVVDGTPFNADYYYNGWIFTHKALSKSDVLQTLRQSDVIENVYNYSTFTSDYFDLTDEEKIEPGIYYGSYSYVSTTGYSGDGVFRIRVLEQIQTDVIYEEPIDYGLIVGIIVSIISVVTIGIVIILLKRKLDYKKQ